MNQPPQWGPQGPQAQPGYGPPPPPPRRGVPAIVWVLVGLFGLPALCAVGCFVCVGAAASHDPAVANGSASQAPPPPKAAPREVAPKLPADPPPFLSERASEAPALEAKLLADKAYATLWDDKHRDDRDLLLTAASESLTCTVRGSADTSIPESVAKALQHRKLMNAALDLASYFARMGRFPDDFTTKTKAYVASLASEPHRGLWSPANADTPPIDFAALAYYLSPEDASLLREVIAAKTSGPIGWENAKDPARPYLVREKAALERLAILTRLTAREQARLGELRASRLGDDPPEEIELKTLLKEYASNEVRADDRYKGHVVEFTGVADGVKRGVIGGITLSIGTGKRFEHPKVDCSFEETQTQKVKAINRGDRVRVRGIVAGLMMGVMVRYCEIVE